MILHPDGRLECTPTELATYRALVQQQTREASGPVMSIVGVTPALRYHITEAIARYQKSMFSY